jgi:hypothetical protein
MLQTGPLLMVLGVALTGCNQAGNEQSKAPVATTTQASDSDYVVTIEGMH